MRADDSQLVERARQGDVDAYGELVRRHQDQALAAAYVILGDRQEAEDATQEAFTNAFLALGRFRPGASFRPWLLRIVIHEAHDLLSARQRRADALSRAAGRVETVGTAESAEAAALSQRRREALLAVLFELPEADRLVVTCRYFLDLSEAEIADILGVARGTVKSRLSRALARLGPILHELGPLVAVPAVVQHGGAGAAVGGKGLVASAWSKVASKARQVTTAASVTVAGVLVASMVLVSRGRSAPAPPAPPPSVIVYGGDLTDADRQELAANLGTDATATQTVSRQELTDTLSAQGIAVQPSDAAISSVRVACGAPGSGLQVETRNISHLTPSEYASVLLIAGLDDGSVVVAAPSDQSVSGETALVGLFKAYPTCAGGAPPDAQRVRLAYAQLRLVADLAGTSPDLTHASAAVLEVLNAVLTGQAQDAAGVQNALDAAATRDGLALQDDTRKQAVSYFEQVRGLEYGPYAHGFVVQQSDQTHVRIAPKKEPD